MDQKKSKVVEDGGVTFSQEEKEEEGDSDCVQERTHQSGLTVWSKVALDLESLAMDRHDFTFSRQIRGEKVPFATAGDCYSTAGFSLDLTGTGLVVASQTVWVEEGHFTSTNITRDKVKVWLPEHYIDLVN